MKPCVYFVRAFFRAVIAKKPLGFVHWKIGCTGDMERRRRAFQTACPVPVEVIGTLGCSSMRDARALERQLHAYFRDERMLGEWFTLNARQVRAVMALVRDWPIPVPVSAYLDEAPRMGTGPDLQPLRSEFVPIAALHEARRVTKELRERLAAAEARVAVVQRQAGIALDHAVEVLTQHALARKNAPNDDAKAVSVAVLG